MAGMTPVDINQNPYSAANPLPTTPGTGSTTTVVQPTAANLQMTMTPANSTTNNLNSAATTNATVAKASAGNLFSIMASNNGAAAAFLKLYDKATAPTVGTDTPIAVISIPLGGFVQYSFGNQGTRFTAGISFAITNLQADADATAVAAGQIKTSLSFI